MKKIIVTESQAKKLVDYMINEQSWSQNLPISQQMRTTKPLQGGKYCFSKGKLAELNQDRSYVLHLVRPGETISTIVKNNQGNSVENVMWANDILRNDPNNVRAGDVIALSLAPNQ